MTAAPLSIFRQYSDLVSIAFVAIVTAPVQPAVSSERLVRYTNAPRGRGISKAVGGIWRGVGALRDLRQMNLTAQYLFDEIESIDHGAQTGQFIALELGKKRNPHADRIAGLRRRQ